MSKDNQVIYDIAKMTQANKTTQQTTLMLWDGNRQLQEYTDTHVFTTVYEQNSFEPVARLVWLKDELIQAANDDEIDGKPINGIQVFHYHNDHLGTPNELTNEKGEVIWLADYETWGNTAKVVYTPIELKGIQVSADELQPLRFQGQFVDTETGLHYNRFRYYDPDLGMFVSRDPIGLMGGVNVFAYAPNPTGWVDPWGLSCSQATPVPHNSTDLSQAVINRRRLDNNFEAQGTNYAAARVKNRDGSIEIITDRNIQGTPMHAELVLISRAHERGQTILDLYSERMPCGNCRSHLKLSAAHANFSYTYPYQSGNSSLNIASRNKLQNYLDSIRGS